MQILINRRQFFGVAAGSLAAVAAARAYAKDAELPMLDLHVHLDNSTLDAVLQLGRERGVKFGIVEHAGTEENVYPVVLSSDQELAAHLAQFEGKDAHKGVQAEWTDWMGCFSPEALAKLDYVLTDAWTFPHADGRRQKLWEKEAAPIYEDADAFIDRFVDWHVQILTNEPINILANVSWLPGGMMESYDRYWTDARIAKVLEAAVKKNVAIEINAGFKLPRLRFLQAAKEAGVKFTFGTNGRYPNMGKLDYSLEMAQQLQLTREDFYFPPQK